ncbi:hypothetical protein EDI_060580 [Entamoeba dispar SAW760]|uniref:UDENN domain-containing protein n=1 Tax=Entamoeba dispar (strain ATCC PRA-260 / SAW760) TaxID=370354 RepID=B0E741_ENTDS|nr:uncharacterized protein EDI_060580 [Entamoeba dispar SAW760]EDR29652.1 hypothetical protein EDI_060580 [Entamoeba dispar SAW760]|eukprot:EDR29652.1 hypothetical protein EDI_060580 [Entamoeba dispar SAW760]
MAQTIISVVYIPRGENKIYAYPPLPQDSPYMFDMLPTLAFPDTENNPCYFVVPSNSPAQRIFGISMVYPSHCIVLLTNSLYFNPLSQLLKAYYPLFSHPNPQLLTSIYNSMNNSPLKPEPIIPPENLFSSIIKLMKLLLLPFKTVYFLNQMESQMKPLDFPLQLDTVNHPIVPQFPGSLIDKIIGTEGYIIGTSNPIFSELTKDWDVVINLDTNKIFCQKEIQGVIVDTREDKLLTLRMKEAYQRRNIISIMQMIEWYYQGLLNTIAPFAKKISTVSWNEIASTPASEYGMEFLKEWLAAPSFQEWKERVIIDNALKLNIQHPGKTISTGFGIYTSETIAAYITGDWMIKSAVKVDNLYKGLESYWKKEDNTTQTNEVEEQPILINEKTYKD